MYRQVSIHCLNVFMTDSLVCERACICEYSRLSEGVCVTCLNPPTCVFKLLIIYEEAAMYVCVYTSQ